MKEECCDIKVTEIENGYRIEVTGKDLKGRCKSVFEKCCSEENIKKCFQSCCGLKEQVVSEVCALFGANKAPPFFTFNILGIIEMEGKDG